MEHQNQVTAEIGSCLTMYSEKMKDFREVEDQDLGYISHEINRTEAGLLRSLVDRRIKRLEGKKTDRRFNRMRPSIAPRKRHQAG